jgi:hypothetical protein
MAEECGPIYEFRKVLPGLAYEYDLSMPPIQLIGLRLREGQEWNMETILNSIDIGLCRIAMDSTGNIFTTEEYRRDVDNRTLTIIDRRDVPRSYDRAIRIQKKFPDFTIVGGLEF